MTQTLNAPLAPTTGQAGAEHLTPNTPKSTPKSTSNFRDIEIAKITPSPHNPRDLFEQEALEGLAASIKARGVLQPIIVRLAIHPSLPTAYEVVDGERRFRAAKLAGLTHIPASIKQDVSDRESLIQALDANLNREDLSPLEKAQGLADLIAMGMTQAELAHEFAMSQSAVSNLLRLRDLPPSARELVGARKLSHSHGLDLLGLMAHQSPETVDSVAEEAAAGGWSVQSLRSIIADRYPKPAPVAEAALPLDVPEPNPGAANFAAPHPEPLAPQGDNVPPQDSDLTDEQWEASARPAPDAEGGDESDGAGDGEERQDVPAGDAGLPDVPPAVTPAAPANSGPVHADPAPAPAKAPTQPQPAKVVAAPAPPAPAAPALPPGMTTLVAKQETVDALRAADLIPLTRVLPRIAEMEASQIPGAALGALARMQMWEEADGDLLMESEREIVAERFPGETGTMLERLMTAIILRRYNSEKKAREQSAETGLPTEGEDAGLGDTADGATPETESEAASADEVVFSDESEAAE